MTRGSRAKRGFTITELVVVIGIIAILAAVLIPTFANIIQRSRESADTQNVEHMNTALYAYEVSNEKPSTMTDVVEVLADSGYLLENLSPTGDGYDIVWDQEHNRLALIDEDGETIYSDGDVSETASMLWTIVDEIPTGEEDKGYSYYLSTGYVGADAVTVTAGVDVGENEGIAVTYATQEAKNVTVRTNGGALTVNAPASNVNHYGTASEVTITAVAQNSYHLYGRVESDITVTSGRVVLESGSSSNTVYVNGGGVRLEWSNNAKPEAVGVSSSVNLNEVSIPEDDEVEVTGSINETYRGLFAGGLGTESSPYLIATAEQFANIGELADEMSRNVAIHFRLTADIDLATITQPASSEISSCFHGTLDGNGYSITSGEQSVWLSVEAVFGTTVKDLTIVQRGGEKNGRFTLFAFAGWCDPVAGSRGTYTFENVTVEGISADTVVSVDTNESAFIQQTNSNTTVNFINCLNSVNINTESYAGIFLGGYAGYSNVTYENCVNTATVTGVTVGFFTGNTAGNPFVLASDANFSDMTDTGKAYAYVDNCRNEGTMIGTVSCGAFSRGNTVLNASVNQAANDALTADMYYAGTMVEGNIDDMSLGVADQGGEQVLQITPSATNEQAVEYSVALRVSVGYQKADGTSAGSSYFIVTFPAVAAAEAGEWTSPYISKVVLSTVYEIDYDAIDAQEQTDDRSHTYKLVRQADGSYWAVVNYESLLLETSWVDIGENGSATIGSAGQTVPTYELTAKNASGQTIGFRRFAGGLTAG